MKKLSLNKKTLTEIKNLKSITGGGPVTDGCGAHSEICITSACTTDDASCPVQTLGCSDNA